MDVCPKKNDYSNQEIRNERRRILKELERTDLSREEKQAIHQQAQASLRAKRDLRHTEAYGEHWIWRSVAPEHKFILADVVGKRTHRECAILVKTTKSRLSSDQDVVYITDGLDTYESVLKENYALKIISKKQTFSTKYEGGYSRESRRVPDEVVMPVTIHYLQCIKHRHPDGRLKNVEKRIVFGAATRIARALHQDADQLFFDTNDIERDNLTRRLNLAKLHRKTLCFAKDKTVLRYQIALDRNVHNFCRTPDPLKQIIPLHERTGRHKYHYRTPAMSAGLTNHVWSLQELLMYATSRT